MTAKKQNALMFATCLLAGFAFNASAQSGVPIAEEGGIGEQWMLADGVTLVAPGYPAQFARLGDNVCVAMAYRINPDGSTADFRLLRGWNSGSGDDEPEPGFLEAFSRATAAALAQWRFKPRPDAGPPRPVDTVATMTFMGRQAEDPSGLRAHCQVDDLASRLRLLDNQGKLAIQRMRAIERGRLDAESRQGEHELLPGTTVDQGTPRSVHGW